MSAWESTAGGLMRRGLTPRGLATVPGPDREPGDRAAAAAEYRSAWEAPRWAFTTPDGKTAVTDNSAVRAAMQRLAADGWQGAWIDAPEAGRPPAVLAPLYAAAAATASGRVGTLGPGGADEALEQMIREADFAKTPWAMPAGRAERFG